MRDSSASMLLGEKEQKKCALIEAWGDEFELLQYQNTRIVLYQTARMPENELNSVENFSWNNQILRESETKFLFLSNFKHHEFPIRK